MVKIGKVVIRNLPMFHLFFIFFIINIFLSLYTIYSFFEIIICKSKQGSKLQLKNKNI